MMVATAFMGNFKSSILAFVGVVYMPAFQITCMLVKVAQGKARALQAARGLCTMVCALRPCFIRVQMSIFAPNPSMLLEAYDVFVASVGRSSAPLLALCKRS